MDFGIQPGMVASILATPALVDALTLHKQELLGKGPAAEEPVPEEQEPAGEDGEPAAQQAKEKVGRWCCMRPCVYWQRLSLEDLPDWAIRRRLQLSAIIRPLCQIMAYLEPWGYEGGHPLPVTVKVTVTVNVCATRSFQVPSGDLSEISQTSVYRYIRTIMEALNARSAQYIRFNVDRAHLGALAEGSVTIAGMPQVQGVINGMHVPLQAQRMRGGLHKLKGVPLHERAASV
ncbi:hypothetical protein scyTo_0001315 [Scyliorhinus torazame]|uniref:Uncharacterized protein n=1 Tax=Scyliorhinus torazame TaxID=75743 RepID=A0A401PBS2_SCYTO|nr:hypothetical protein [Scyliorhinus torazame]